MIADPQEKIAGFDTPHAYVKEQKLRTLMREMNSVLVAYSGGVDSSYLAVVAAQELGPRALCILGLSPSVSEFQRAEARDTAERHHLNFEAIETDELADARYAANPANRCYFCKSELFAKLTVIAGLRRIPFILDGTNADDISGHRPGMKASEENGVRSVLAEIGMTKDEIRQMSLAQGIKGWDKPASPCLASRVAYGVPVTIERLSRIERGEDLLRELGFTEFRLRDHNERTSIEISTSEMGLAHEIDVVGKLAGDLGKIGFRNVELDERGFRSGSMNEVS